MIQKHNIVLQFNTNNNTNNTKDNTLIIIY